MEYKHRESSLQYINVLKTRFNYCCWIIQEIMDGIYPYELLGEWLEKIEDILDNILIELNQIKGEMDG